MTSWSKASIQMQFRAVDGSPVVLKAPPRARSVPTRLRSRKTGCPLNLISTYLPVDGDQASTGACSRYQLSGRNGSEFGASGSVVGPAGGAKTALASRIYVEGRHDAELVEKIWGDDLRHVGVVVEYLGGIDDLPGVVADFAPGEGRQLGVLVDHLVAGSKESGVADRVRSGAGRGHVLVLGHPYVDIWQAVKPARLGLAGWPEVPRTVEWKHGICAALGLPHRDQADVAAAWRMILDQVRSWDDLERPLLTVVEQLIDFVTEDHH